MSLKVIDFFCGCGGASKGFENAGFEIALGIDFEKHAADSYQSNFKSAEFINRDIRKVRARDVAAKIPDWKEHDLVFCACAPCQPFSSQNKGKSHQDQRASLLMETARFVRAFRPKFIFLENVPGIQRVKADEIGPFQKYLKFLSRLGYKFDYKLVSSEFYGIPQKRKRLVMMARLGLTPVFPEKTHGTEDVPFANVRQYIKGMTSLQAGESDPEDPLHKASPVQPQNLERLANTPEGGDRRDWPDRLWLDCHKKYKGHTDVYGRMSWGKLAPTLTTRCTSISNGRFGHPDTNQNRALTLREAACLQTFPKDFIFCGGMVAQSKQIGNAVPVLLAQRFAEAVHKQLREKNT